MYNKSVCSLVCANGSFALPGMSSCHPLLSCDNEITLISTLSHSVVKTIYLVKWKEYKMVLSVLVSPKYEKDFKHHLQMVKSLNSHFVIDLLGFCHNSFLSKYYELGSASNFNYHLMHSLKAYDSIKTRLNMCKYYVSIVSFLHTSPAGVRVMCDSNSLEKTLSQYLLTSDLKLVVSDLDATPLVDKITGNGVHCGPKPLSGNFVAPEQIWPYPDQIYNINKMPYYNEKTDIWKLPDVCNWFIGNSSSSDIVKYKLFNVHKMCKDKVPARRPTAYTVLKAYEKVLNELE